MEKVSARLNKSIHTFEEKLYHLDQRVEKSCDRLQLLELNSPKSAMSSVRNSRVNSAGHNRAYSVRNNRVSYFDDVSINAGSTWDAEMSKSPSKNIKTQTEVVIWPTMRSSPSKHSRTQTEDIPWPKMNISPSKNIKTQTEDNLWPEIAWDLVYNRLDSAFKRALEYHDVGVLYRLLEATGNCISRL